MEVTNEKIRAKINEIISDKQPITSLDFTSAQDREIALQCLKEKQKLAVKLDAYDDNQREVLNKWVKLSYSNILLLNKDQLHPELIDTYLYARLCDPASTVKGASVYNGYNQEHILSYQYETKDSAAVCYFDKEWGCLLTSNRTYG